VCRRLLLKPFDLFAVVLTVIEMADLHGCSNWHYADEPFSLFQRFVPSPLIDVAGCQDNG
jgi:hypothetical protein